LTKKKKKKELKEQKEDTRKNQGSIESDTDRWLSIAILILLPFIYFFPYIFDPGRMIFGTDWTPVGGYARMFWKWSFFLDFLTVPKWTPYLFSGFSSITAYADTTFYPLYLLTAIFPANLQQVLLFTIHSCLGGIGIFFLLRLLGCGIYPALFAGVVYEYSGVMLTTTYAGHLGRMVAVALLPVSFYFLLRALKRRSLASFLLFGGFIGLHLLGGHFQMTYLALISMFLFLLYYLFTHIKDGWKERLNLVFYFGLSGLLASALNAVRYLPTYVGLEHGARGFERGYEYATSWSLPVIEIFDIIVPHFSGSSIQAFNNYWSLNYFKLGGEYLGILPVVLAIAAIAVLWKQRNVKFFFFYTILFILFAFGGNTPFYKIPYHVIPMLPKFRAPAMLFFMASFGLIVLAGIGLNAVTGENSRKRELSRAVGVITAVFFLLAIVLTIFGGQVLGFLKGLVGDNIETTYGVSERVRRLGLLELHFPDIQKRMWIGSILSLILYGGLYLLEKGKATKRQVVLGLMLITVFDQWSVDRHYLESAPPHDTYFAEDDVVSFLKRDRDLFRVFPMQYRHNKDGLLLLNSIQSIGGYGANPPRRYQQFIGAGESVMFNPINLYKDRDLLNLLNVKYIILPPLPEDLSVLSQTDRRMAKAFKDYVSLYEKVFSGSHDIYLNSNSLPRVYVVHDYRIVDNEEKALEAVLGADFDYGRSVILEKDPGIENTEGVEGLTPVKIIDYDPHKLTCSVDLAEPGILVVCENHHPDWKVYVDGEEKELLHANHVAKGVAVTGGLHTVEFKYRSYAFEVGKIITLLSFVVVGWLIYGWRRGKY
jgi:hypothetical protein